MVGMDVGVAWAVVLENIGGASGDQGMLKEGESNTSIPPACEQNMTCDKGYFFDDETCNCEKIDTSDETTIKCEIGQFYSEEWEQCEDWDTYCGDQDMEYDPVIGNCYVPGTSQGTLLPETRFVESECEQLFTQAASELNLLQDIMTNDDEPFELTIYNKDGTSGDRFFYPLDVLGCSIKTGRISMWMIPFFVKYLIQFAISIAGLVAVGAIIIGGYFYLFSGLDNDKERGKKAIMYGLLGFVVVLLAWTIVNAAMGLFTR